MLTKRQKQVLDFITEYSRKNGISPTIDEIRKHFRLNSVATIHQHLESLRSKGYLDRLKNKTRSLSLPKKRSVSDLISKSSRSGFALVPLLGSANAGPATFFAEENIEAYQKVPRTIVRKQSGIFAVRVDGDSMNKASIDGNNLEDGDLAIIDSEYKSPKSGDYVLAVRDGLANLKKFLRDQKTGDVILISESSNPKHKPIKVSSEDDFMINGRIIGVVKR
ncbi:MAG: repressor LexA [Candidatus Doudnabacteria bacterium CG10_big_fil_rev_8_21_14_0_10_41_10]|uniref:Repressor LexA n=1 Tax=Candidatus Doudnabacteria bacterium CG10_big_fil_rev_8_21_14_0_10_41_10 TaxID=1974551 RepID=A0A2H0VCT2_9BACT|nr:MAG: repressor LexA [Candidatus Doudnabacteria bacterium CG10_big_fil_rev_8_21_14_0_10_41_10]